MATVPSHRPQSSPRSPPDPFTDPATAQRRPPPLPPKSTAKSSGMHLPGSKSVQAPRDAHPDLAEAVRDTVVVRPIPETKNRSRVGRSHTAQSVLVLARFSTSSQHRYITGRRLRQRVQHQHALILRILVILKKSQKPLPKVAPRRDLNMRM